LERKGRVVKAELGFQIRLFAAKAVKNADQLDILENVPALRADIL